jgi:23S rRNA (cytosine1962-C5)-methyltransferase
MRCPELPADGVVFEDDDLIVVNKPPGVVSQAVDAQRDDDLPARVKRYVAARRGVPADEVYLGTHQRLDRDTSGLVLYTLRREANAAIAAQLEGRSAEKTYLACVTGLSPFSGERTLSHELERGRDGLMQVAARASKHSKRAITRVRFNRANGPRALVSLGCDTGRTHQLRVQLAHAGAPIAGDAWYRGAPAFRLMLHAAELRIAHPTSGEPLTLRAPVPLELEHFFEHGDRPVSESPELLARALELAVHARYRFLREPSERRATTALRLFNREGDGDSELAVELYGDHLVANLYGPGIGAREAQVIDALAKLDPSGEGPCAGVYVKRHPIQKNTLIDPRDARFAPPDPIAGMAAPSPLVVRENELPIEVNLGEGLRTGIFLDQRDNRRRVRELAMGKRVLNLFAYTGGFSVAALLGGAELAVCVDVSATALAQAKRNVERIGKSDRHRTLRSDVFDALARCDKKGERFDIIVLDPPSFSTTRSGRLEVRRDYARLVAAAFAVLSPGGSLMACVNHHGVGPAWLADQLRRGAGLAGREVARIAACEPPDDFRMRADQAPPSTCALLLSK